MNDKVLVVFACELREQIRSQLASFPAKVYFADTLTEFAEFVRGGEVFEVAILPSATPEVEATYWELCGELSLLNTKPELLVCAQKASFRLWSGVLDAGGYDVLTAPFSSEELQGAVRHAIESFKRRAGSSNAHEKQID